ncbi:MAG: CopD family protein [Massilia sp.]
MPAITALLNLMLAWLTGATLVLAWLRHEHSAWSTDKQAQLRRTMPCALLVAFLAQCMLLWLEAALMSELPLLQAAAEIPTVIGSTHFGLWWAIGSTALLAAAVGARIRRLALLGLGLTVFMLSRSTLGHAALDGDLSWTILVDLIHLASASGWTGLVLVAVRMLSSAQDRATASSGFFPALSRAATFALACVLLSGILNAWRHLGGAAITLTSPYTLLLAAKMGLVFGAAALGGVNRFIVMPSLPSRLDASGRFAAILRCEALILTIVLILAAILSATPPPGTAD